MAYLTLDRDVISHNFQQLKEMFKARNISWSVVTKLLCGHRAYLELLLDLGIEECCDSRISNLKLIKEINPKVQTIYIKPPAKLSIPDIVKYADVSFNTEFVTLKWLSDEAVRQDKKHKALIMIELGDLREGIMGDHLIDFYEKIFDLPNIEVVGIGSNLNCLYGVMPSSDKLVQLSLYKRLIEATFNHFIPWVSGGTSVVIPLILSHQLPSGINHFRIGETLFYGNNITTGEILPGFETNSFKLFSEIIEITKKPMVPTGELELNPSGEQYILNEENRGKESYRAIIDIGKLDTLPEFLHPSDNQISISGASSDMIVLELGKNERNYKVGDLIEFTLDYMGVLGLMNSDYIGKKITSGSNI